MTINILKTISYSVLKPLNIYIIVLSLIIFTDNCKAQSDIIAKIGYKELTKNEFRLRYELSPRVISGDSETLDSIKLKFLYTLISEKLWAMESFDKGLSNSEEFKFYYTPIEKMYVRDEVFRIEVKEKVEVTDADISKGINKYVKNLKMRVISSDDSSNIFNLYSGLINSGSIDSLLIINPVITPQTSSLELKFGELNDEILEDELFQLSINEFTRPAVYADNWFIFELDSIKSNIPDFSQNKLENEVEEIIRERRTRNNYNDFYKKYFGGYIIKADDDVFIKISEAFYNTIKSHQKLNAPEVKPDKYYLTENDILKVKQTLGGDFLNRELFNSKYGSVKVYEFLSDLTIVDVSFKEVNDDVINKVLANELKRFIQQETVYRIGSEMGIQYSSEVESELNMWRDNLVSQMLKNSYNSQIEVTEGEVNQYYNEMFSDTLIVTQLNVQSISSVDLELVKTILNQIENGKSFEQIVSEFESSKSVFVENLYDYNRLKDFGNAANIIVELDAGEIFGPIKTESGYTIIKVVEPGVMSDSVKMGIEKVEGQIRQKLFHEKLNQLLEDKTIELANKFGITLSEDFIYSEHYSGVNMFVHRYMGFGGRIAAVPFISPFYNWYLRWTTQSGINP